jgi:hypothetical protein
MTRGPARSTASESYSDERSPVTLLRLLTNAFERQGWRNEGDAALELVEIYLRKGALSAADLRVVPSAFYDNNSTTKKRVLTVANDALNRGR